MVNERKMNMVYEVNSKVYFKYTPYLGALGSTGRSWGTVAEFPPSLAQTIRKQKG
jgi:hypothetical protein